jgi:hypothetical protein
MQIDRGTIKHVIHFAFHLSCFISLQPVLSQAQSSVVNSAAPEAQVSTNTSGGTNINQQLNNVYDTSYGFGPGIICRTPQLLINGNILGANSNLNSFPLNNGTSTFNSNFSGTIGIAVPFASSVIDDCKRFAAQIAKDREISSELSFIRACAQLEKEKLVIDPIKYPNLARCLGPMSSSLRPAKPDLSKTPPQPVQSVTK